MQRWMKPFSLCFFLVSAYSPHFRIECNVFFLFVCVCVMRVRVFDSIFFLTDVHDVEKRSSDQPFSEPLHQKKSRVSE